MTPTFRDGGCAVLGLWLLVGCSAEVVRFDDDSEGRSSQLCTWDASTWGERCEAGGGIPQLCDGLRGSWPAIAALRLNIDASDRGESPTGLGDMLAQHPAWRAPLRELAQRPATPALEALATAMNTNYAACEADRSMLAPAITTTVCGTTEQVEGAAGSPCSNLASACMRASLEEGNDCCSADPVPAGVACAAGRGVCDGRGACVGTTDRIRASAPYRGVVGNPRWIDTNAASPIIVEHLTPGVRLRSEEGVSADIVVSGDLSLGAIHLYLPYVPYVPYLPSESLGFGAAALAVDQPVDTTGLHIPRLLDTAALCVWTGPVSSEAMVWSNCATPGSIELPCPGAVGGVSCEVTDDAFVVRSGAPNILAWERTDDESAVELGSLVLSNQPPPPPNAGCSLGEVQGCTNSCGEASVQVCDLFGNWGPCQVDEEVCDGADNDCDGLVDEGPAHYNDCDDGLPCTGDICVTTVDGAACVNDDACVSPAACAIWSQCVAEAPAVEAGERAVLIPATGCWETRSDRACRDEWDGCDCNGLEVCDPELTADPTGCFRPDLPPCESDGDLCTLEACCETNDNCVTGVSPTFTILGETYSCMDLEGETQPRAPGDEVTVWCPTPPEQTIAGVTIPTQFDRTTLSQARGGCSDQADCDGLDVDACESLPDCEINVVGDCVRLPDCTFDECDPATGQCSNPPRADGWNCGERISDDLCGEFECSNGVCEIGNNHLLVEGSDLQCEDVEGMIGPFGEPLTRLGATEYGTPIEYSGDFLYQSCHLSSCVNGFCSFGLAPEVCDAFDNGCVDVACSDETTWLWFGTIGCRPTHDDAACPPPEGTECFEPQCVGDGECKFNPSDELCQAPPDSECFRAACSESGHCELVPDGNLCIEECGEPADCTADGNCSCLG